MKRKTQTNGSTQEASIKKVNARTGERSPVRSVLNQPILVETWTKFTQIFGGFVAGAYLPDAVYFYFASGGGPCYVVSIRALVEGTGGGAAASVAIPGKGRNSFTIAAKTIGEAGNGLTVTVANDVDEAGKATGILFFNPDDYKKYHDMGIRFIACGADATFVADGMRKFMTFVNATGQFIPSYKLDKLNTLTRLYRLGPVTQEGELECTENCKEVSAEAVIRYAIDLLKEAEMDEYDLKIMGWLGTDDLYEDSFWNKVAIEEGNRRHLGLLDLTFQRIGDDTSKTLHGGMDNYFLGLTKKYYDTEMSVGNFFFEPRPSIKKMIKANYAQYVANYENRIEEFLAKYEELRKDPSLKIEGVHRNRRDFIAVPTEKGPNGEDLPVYISVDRKNKYFGTINIFHERTSGEFKRQ